MYDWLFVLLSLTCAMGCSSKANGGITNEFRFPLALLLNHLRTSFSVGVLEDLYSFDF